MQRNTIQRKAIQQVFEDIEHPLSPKEVLDKAQATVPQLGLATVYRTLNSFIDEGILTTVEVPGETQRYEKAGKHHHHHFNCRVCGRMFEMEGCPGNLSDIVPKGFQMEDHELFIYGRCKSCITSS